MSSYALAIMRDVVGLASSAALGPYTLESAIGAGGMGEVYRATDTRLSRTVAVKVLPEALLTNAARRQRFEREARAASTLNHPHICTVYDVGDHDGRPFLVMELIEGESLAQRLQRGPLAVDEAVRIGIEIAEALDHAHRRRIIHRDLKPANIMLAREGAKLLDFGLARVIEPEGVEIGSGAVPRLDTLTEDGTILGTVQYMAPEQLEGHSTDARTDLFAFGGVMYEMLTGRPAFTGATKASIIAAILDRDPPPMSEVRESLQAAGAAEFPPALESLVMRCLAKSPDERWQTARDLREALRWAPGRSTAQAHPPRRWTALGFAGRALAAGVLASLTFVGYRMWPARSSDAPPVVFTVTPPPNAAFNDSAASFTLSPDGKYLAFCASTAGGNNAIWIRTRDALTPRQLPGTEKAAQPFWSADGRYLAFWSNGFLKKIDITTEVVETITAAPGLQSGSWNRDGDIVYGPSPREPRLFRTSGSGRTPVPATKLNAFPQGVTVQWAQFLPDGRHFLFLARSQSPDFEGAVYVGSLDSDVVQRITFSDSHVVYAPPGYLLFIRGTTLLAQRFDAASLRLEGDPLPLADPVERAASRRGAFAVSSSGTLVYRSTPETQLAWFDRAGNRIGSVGPPGQYRNPALSPDGARIAVERPLEDANSLDVWVIDLARNVPQRLTYDGSRAPLWSLDGVSIVTVTGGALVRRPFTGGPATPLGSVSGAGANPLGWTPDGSLIYEAHAGESQESVLRLPQSGGSATKLLHGASDDTQAQISPDGRWLAYVSDESGRNDVYVRPFPTGDGQWVVSDAGGIEPQWSGHDLLYLALDGTLTAVAFGDSAGAAPGRPVPLFATRMSTLRNPGFTRNQYVVAKDGRILINQPPPNAPPPALTVIVNWPSLLLKAR